MISKEIKEADVPQIVAPPLFGSGRLTAALMCMAAFFCAIESTINLGIGIVCINKRSLNHQVVNNNGNCSSSSFENGTMNTSSSIYEDDELYIDKPSQGMLLGAVYYGVVTVQLVFGWMCDKYGNTKLLMMVGNAVLGVASVLSPVVLEHLGVSYFFVIRVILGIAMAAVIMPIVTIQVRWSTPRDQGLMVGISSSGLGIANAVTYPISGLLCEYTGWRSIFYFSGIICLLWVVLAQFLVFDSPQDHPRISVDEKQYLVSYSQSSTNKNGGTKAVIPWKKILTSIPVWALVFTNFFFFAATKGTVINLPIFIKDVLGFSVGENGIYSALPLIAALIIHFLMGPLFDYTRRKKFFSLTITRKTYNTIGTIIPAVLMFTISQILSADSKYLIIILITIGYALNEVAWMGGFYFDMMDIAPDFVGVLQGINKTIGLAPGFIIPMVISALTPDGTAEEWGNVFLVFGGFYVISGLVFLFFGSAELQKWGKIQTNTKILI